MSAAVDSPATVSEAGELVSGAASPQEPPADKQGFWSKLGPGLITGAADDDPSGIATHTQAGAQFG